MEGFTDRSVRVGPKFSYFFCPGPVRGFKFFVGPDPENQYFLKAHLKGLRVVSKCGGKNR